jgi:catechol 2,3-dioxygenase
MPIFPQNPNPAHLRQRQADELLAAGTMMGAVELLVHDLDAMLKYYTEAITLEVLQHSGSSAVLGRHGKTAMTLKQVKDLPPAKPGQAGLFHTAILFEDAAALAAAVAHAATKAPQSFTGSADHLYSEAFYFDDPEGNGVELYTDRPRETWRHEDNGLLSVATNFLDPNAYLQDNLTQENLARPTARDAKLGHVHLQVGDIEQARAFYVDTLGFGLMSDVGSALFISAGGYHHHIGLNVWNSAGAGPRAAALGLGQVNIDVPTLDDVAALESRLKGHGIATRHDGATLRFDDPWKTLIQVSAAA